MPKICFPLLSQEHVFLLGRQLVQVHTRPKFVFRCFPKNTSFHWDDNLPKFTHAQNLFSVAFPRTRLFTGTTTCPSSHTPKICFPLLSKNTSFYWDDNLSKFTHAQSLLSVAFKKDVIPHDRLPLPRLNPHHATVLKLSPNRCRLIQGHPPLTILYLVRHGETEGNAADLAQGHFDVPLNEKGRAQAELLGQRLKNRHFDAIYSSDSMRTLQTAEPLLKLRPDYNVETTPELREKSFGDCENYPWQRLKDEFPQILDPEIGSDFRFPGGESDRDHMHRVARFTCEIIGKHVPDASILIFSHGGSIKAAAAHMCNFRLEDKWRLKTDNTGISSIISEPTWRDDGWQIERWNDTHHLNLAQLTLN